MAAYDKSSVDIELDKAYSKAKLKLGGTALKTIYFIKSGCFIQIPLIPTKVASSFVKGAVLSTKYAITSKKVIKDIEELLDKTKEQKNSFKAKLGVINGIIRSLAALQKLANYDETYYFDSSLKGFKNPNTILNYLINNRYVTQQGEKYILTADESSEMNFLNPGVDAVVYRKLAYVRAYDPNYEFYSKSGDNYKKFEGSEKEFDPSLEWYIKRETNMKALREVANMNLNLVIETLKENKEMQANFKADRDAKPTKLGQYTLIPAKVYIERRQRHRMKQVMLIEIKDAMRILNSNFFAERWNIADSFKHDAAMFMTYSLQLILAIPKAIAAAAQAAIEPMAAVITTPVGPAVCVTNMQMIIGTVTHLKTISISLSAVLANVTSLMASIGLDQFPAMAMITGMVATLGMILGTLESILNSLPSL